MNDRAANVDNTQFTKQLIYQVGSICVSYFCLRKTLCCCNLTLTKRDQRVAILTSRTHAGQFRPYATGVSTTRACVDLHNSGYYMTCPFTNGISAVCRVGLVVHRTLLPCKQVVCPSVVRALFPRQLFFIPSLPSLCVYVMHVAKQFCLSNTVQ